MTGLAATQSIYRRHSEAVDRKWPEAVDGVERVVVRRYDLFRRVPWPVLVDAGSNKWACCDLQFNCAPCVTCAVRVHVRNFLGESARNK